MADDGDYGGKTEWEDALIKHGKRIVDSLLMLAPDWSDTVFRKGIMAAPEKGPDEDEEYTEQVERAQERKQNRHQQKVRGRLLLPPYSFSESRWCIDLSCRDDHLSDSGSTKRSRGRYP